MINLFQPSVGEAELDAVRRVFTSRWLGGGPMVRSFEAVFADMLGASPDDVVAVTSCTEGLFQVIEALNLGPGDDVVLPTISFIGAAHAVRHAGAGVVLCDVDPITLNPTAGHVAAALTPATRAIVVLHYGGGPGDLAAIAALARERGIVLVEDAACGLGATCADHPCGTVGDVGVWSFDAMKLITTAGDGGMVWSSLPGFVDNVRLAVSLGGASTGFAQRERRRWWEIDPVTAGRRSGMNDVAAAVGLVQLNRMGEFLNRRQHICATYDHAFEDLPWLRLPTRGPGSVPTFYWVQLDGDRRDELAALLLAHDIYVSFRYWPLHATRLYRSAGRFPGADQAATRTLMLPLHHDLGDDDVHKIVHAVRSFRPGR